MPQLKDKPTGTKTAKNEQPQKARHYTGRLADDADPFDMSDEEFAAIPTLSFDKTKKAFVVKKSDGQNLVNWAVNG